MTTCWTAGCEDKATHVLWALNFPEPRIARCREHTGDYRDQMLTRGVVLVMDELLAARNEQ